MSTVSKRPNVKLAKLFYKYNMDERKEPLPPQPAPSIPEPKDYESYPPYNFSWFIKGKIAAMGWPQNVANLNYLADVGVHELVTLSPEKRPPILECEKKLKWTEIRVKEFGAPTLKQILQFIAICERAEIKGEVLGLHCRHGRGRTGTMLACYLVYFKNMAPERAVLTVRVQRPGSCETFEQEKMVCHYRDCLRGTVTKPDYRLVEDKVYFDCSMKQMYDEEKSDSEEISREKKTSNQIIDINDKDRMEKAKEKVKSVLKKKKLKAMVIHHKIYF